MEYYRCLRFDNGEEGTAVTGTTVNFTNVLGDCDNPDQFTPADVTYRFTETNYRLDLVLTLDDAWALTNPQATVTAPSITAVANGSGFVFDSTDYIGGVEPGTAAADAWWAGWIIPGSLD